MMKKISVLFLYLLVGSKVFALSPSVPSIRFFFYGFPDDTTSVLQLLLPGSPKPFIFPHERDTSGYRFYYKNDKAYASYKPGTTGFILRYCSHSDTLISEPIQPEAYTSVFHVTTDGHTLSAEDHTPAILKETPVIRYLTALFYNLVSYAVMSLLLMKIFGYTATGRFTLFVLAVRLVSFSVFWFVIMGLMNNTTGFILGSVFLIVSETLAMYFLTKRSLPAGKLALLILFLNISSMMCGGVTAVLKSVLTPYLIQS